MSISNSVFVDDGIQKLCMMLLYHSVLLIIIRQIEVFLKLKITERKIGCSIFDEICNA